MSFHSVDVYVGKRMRERRTSLGMSQTALGEAVDLTFQQIQKYERGANRVGASRLFEFAKVLDVPIGFFFENLGKRAAPVQPASETKHPGAPAPEEIGNRETLEMTKDYLSIRDPKMRLNVRKIIRLVAESDPRTMAADRKKKRKPRHV